MLKDMQIKGVHATYWKSLCNTPGNVAKGTDTSNFKIFERYVDAYLVAPILGCIYGRKGSNDLPPSDDTAGMQMAVQMTEQKKIMYVYRLIMLMDNDQILTDTQKIDRAFRDDTNEEAMKLNTALYNDYFCGGLEILYDTFVAKCTTDNDYINKIYEYVKMFKETQNIDDLEIADILKVDGSNKQS
jgi:hypothetical protein